MFEASLKDSDFLFSKTPVLLTEKKENIILVSRIRQP